MAKAKDDWRRLLEVTVALEIANTERDACRARFDELRSQLAAPEPCNLGSRDRAKILRPRQDALLRPSLADMIDMRHELVKLTELGDWEFFETEWSGFSPSHAGRPATSPRLALPGAQLSAVG